MSSVENTSHIAYSPTMKREALVKDKEKLNSIFDKYDLDGNGELDSDEVNRVLDDYAKTEHMNKRELKEAGFDKGEISSLRKFMSNFKNEFKKDVYTDSKINYSKQGKYGDCWVLSGVNALSYTDEGKKMIEEAISKDENGNIIVKLKGPGREYVVTKEELLNDENGVRGDYDMKALEIAIKKYRADLVEENKDNPDRNASIHTYTGWAKEKDPLSGGWGNETIWILTGKTGKTYFANKEKYNENLKNGKIEDSCLYPEEIRGEDLTLDDVSESLNNMTDEPGIYATNCAFKKNSFSQPELRKGHSYAVKRVTEDHVFVVNPWNSSKEIKIPKKEFLKNLEELSIVDMKKEE